MSVTVVTAFFNLSKIENSTRHNRGAKFYLNKGHEILKQDINLVIFTEQEYVDDIIAMRGQYINKTRIVITEIHELPYYKYLNQVTDNLAKNPIHNRCLIKDTPLYLTLQMNKLYYLKNTISTNPFKSEYFAWCDFGISHIADMQYLIQDNTFNKINDKVSLMVMRNYDGLCDNVQLYLSAISGIAAAGFITGNKENLLWFIQAADNKYKEIIELGYVASEEMLFPLVFNGNEDRFKFYYGDYPNILSNYVHHRSGFGHIMWMMRRARDEGFHIPVCRYGKALLDSYDNKTLNCTDYEAAELICSYYISAYYVDKILAESLIYKYIAMCKINESFIQHYNNNKSMVIQNFKHLIDDVEILLN